MGHNNIKHSQTQLYDAIKQFLRISETQSSLSLLFRVKRIAVCSIAKTKKITQFLWKMKSLGITCLISKQALEQGHREEQKDWRFNGYSISATRRIQIAWESAPTLLQKSSFPANSDTSQGTALLLPTCTRERLPSDSLLISTILNTTHNKRLYKTELKKCSWKNWRIYTVQKFLKIRSKKVIWIANKNKMHLHKLEVNHTKFKSQVCSYAPPTLSLGC